MALGHAFGAVVDEAVSGLSPSKTFLKLPRQHLRAVHHGATMPTSGVAVIQRMGT